MAIADRDPVRRKTMLFCKCDCGNMTISAAKDILNGRTKGCGCLQKIRNVRRYPDPIISSAKIVYRERYKDGDLTFEDFYKLSQLPCHYCGASPSQKFNTYKIGKRKLDSSKLAQDTGDFIYNGIDRIDNNKDHSIGNVVPCCKVCNFAKRDMTIEEFKKWIERVHSRLVYF